MKRVVSRHSRERSMSTSKLARTLFVAAAVAAMLVIPAGVATATDLYWSGDGTWNTTDANWGTVTGGPYTGTTWNNATPDNAIFEGTAGTVTLGEPISIGDMTINADDYTITGNTLNFAPGSTLTDTGVAVTIESGITGAPTVNASYRNAWGTSYGAGGLYLNPIGANMELGDLNVTVENYLYLGGDENSNNSVGDITAPRRNKLRFNGLGTWTVGSVYSGEFYIDSGNLIVNGTLTTNYRQIQLKGGVLHYNNEAAIGPDEPFYIMGGDMDNSSGAAITTSLNNPSQEWRSDWTFIGSNGADSDLNFGTGKVTLQGDYQVTIQNADTTLTVGGAVGDGGNAYGLTKAGLGTLALTGFTNYSGTTTVAAGTLSLGDDANSTNLVDSASVDITTGAMLDLNFTGIDDVFALFFDGSIAATGTWGSTSSDAENQDDTYFSGTGILNNAGGIFTDGRFYWDGSNIGGTGDGASAGGDGTWSTSVENWDHGYTTRKTWTNSTDNKAVFAGTAGTVTLDSDITLGELEFDSSASANYKITGHNLNFGGAATITINADDVVIESGITGSPNVVAGTPTGNHNLTFAPTSESMTLGTITRPTDTIVVLGGETAGNTVVAIPKGNGNAKVRKNGPGTWTVEGDCYGGHIWVDEGTLIVNGKLYTDYRDLTINDGGTIVINGTFDPRDNDPVNFNSGGTMKGTGTIVGPMTAGPMNVKAGAILAPGFPTGTLTIENADCTIAGTLAITIDGDSYSTLAVGGTLDISAATATLDITELSAGTGDMVIATYTTLIGDLFETINGLSAGWDIDYEYNEGTAIALIGGSPSGDANGDGVVDSADYIMVKTHFGGAPAAGTDGSGGDFDGDGTVDWDDLQTLMEGMNSSTGGAPIPEPATLFIMLAAGIPALLRRRRSRG